MIAMCLMTLALAAADASVRPIEVAVVAHWRSTGSRHPSVASVGRGSASRAAWTSSQTFDLRRDGFELTAQERATAAGHWRMELGAETARDARAF